MSWRSDDRSSWCMIRGRAIGLSMFLRRPHCLTTLTHLQSLKPRICSDARRNLKWWQHLSLCLPKRRCQHAGQESQSQKHLFSKNLLSMHITDTFLFFFNVEDRSSLLGNPLLKFPALFPFKSFFALMFYGHDFPHGHHGRWRSQGFLPQLDEFYFTTVEKKLFRALPR